MILYGLAALVFLLGTSLMALAYLSAHRTIIPAIRHAVYLWWPGVGLQILALFIALGPSVFAYGQCQAACDVLDGTPTTEFAKNVPKDYANCVESGKNEVRRTVLERIKEGVQGLDADQAANDAEPEIREVCAGMVVGQCVAVCYNPQPGEEDQSTSL